MTIAAGFTVICTSGNGRNSSEMHTHTIPLQFHIVFFRITRRRLLVTGTQSVAGSQNQVAFDSVETTPGRGVRIELRIAGDCRGRGIGWEDNATLGRKVESIVR